MRTDPECNVTAFLFCAFLACALLNFLCTLFLLRGLIRAGITVSFLEMRWQIHRHMKRYREITAGRIGKIAWPYCGYQASLAGMISFGVLTLIALGE